MLGEFLQKYVSDKMALYDRYPDLKQPNDFEERTR